MKKFLRVLAVFSGLMIFLSFINRLILSIAAKKRLTGSKEHYYKWTFGNIRYITMGKGKPLLLVHDFRPGFSSAEWESTIKRLAKHNEVYALDLLGFGYSDKPNLSYSTYLYASLINDFVRDVICEKVNLIASSGSSCFAVYAYALAPDRFNKIMLVSPRNIGGCVSKLFGLPVVGLLAYNILTSRLWLWYYFKTRCGKRKIDLAMLDRFYYPAHYGMEFVRFPLASAEYLKLPMEHRLAEITAPLCIVWGSNDTSFEREKLVSLLKNRDNVSFKEIKNTQGMPHDQYPGQFAALCNQFFGKNNF